MRDEIGRILIPCAAVKNQGGSTLRFPIAKGEACDDNAVNVAFGISGGVPNALYRRITATCHSIDRVVVPRNVDNNGTGAFAAHFALRHFGNRTAV